MMSSCSSSSSSSSSPISLSSSPLPLSRSTKNRQQKNLGFRAVNSNCNNIPATPARNYVDGVGSSRTTSVDNDEGIGDSTRTCNTNASVPAVNRQHHCTTTANSNNKNQQKQQSADNSSTPVQELLQLLDHTEFHDLPKFPKEFRMDDYAQRQRLRPRESSSATAKTTSTKINRQQEESNNNDCSSSSNNNKNNNRRARRRDPNVAETQRSTRKVSPAIATRRNQKVVQFAADTNNNDEDDNSDLLPSSAFPRGTSFSDIEEDDDNRNNMKTKAFSHSKIISGKGIFQDRTNRGNGNNHRNNRKKTLNTKNNAGTVLQRPTPRKKAFTRSSEQTAQTMPQPSRQQQQTNVDSHSSLETSNTNSNGINQRLGKDGQKTVIEIASTEAEKELTTAFDIMRKVESKDSTDLVDDAELCRQVLLSPFGKNLQRMLSSQNQHHRQPSLEEQRQITIQRQLTEEAEEERAAAREWAEKMRTTVKRWAAEQRSLIRAEEMASQQQKQPYQQQRLIEAYQAAMARVRLLEKELQDSATHYRAAEEHLNIVIRDQQQRIDQLEGQLQQQQKNTAKEPSPPRNDDDHCDDGVPFVSTNQVEGTAPKPIDRRGEDEGITNNNNISVTTINPTPHDNRRRRRRKKQVSPDGNHQIITYSNGSRKEILSDGTVIIRFVNGDHQTQRPDHTIVYYYALQDVLQITDPRSTTTFLEFPSGQTELHHADGRKTVTFSDGTVKEFYPLTTTPGTMVHASS